MGSRCESWFSSECIPHASSWLCCSGPVYSLTVLPCALREVLLLVPVTFFFILLESLFCVYIPNVLKEFRLLVPPSISTSWSYGTFLVLVCLRVPFLCFLGVSPFGSSQCFRLILLESFSLWGLALLSDSSSCSWSPGSSALLLNHFSFWVLVSLSSSFSCAYGMTLFGSFASLSVFTFF